MKILLGVDESPHSNAAVEFVKKMQWPKGTRVLVVSAARPPIMAYSEVYVPAAPHTEAMIEQEVRYHEELAARAEETLRVPGIATEARVVTGDPREVLIAEARSSGADLIVVGSHGRTGLTKMLLGSVASHVVTHAPCSVMVVKLPESKFAKK
jgi:nucleotide-binding universal stress UspA family protein